MQVRSIRHAPVVDEKGQLVGMVSDRDLRQVILEPALRDAFEMLDEGVISRPGRWGVEA
jgi:CBS domain-containing protein